MASLGRLTIDLVANMGGFETDFKRASTTAQREMRKVSRQLKFAERDAEAASRRFSQLATRIAAVAGVSLGLAIRQFRDLSQEADRIQKLGIATGLTAEAVQELGFAAEQSGSNLEAVVKGVQQLQKNIVQANDGLATYVRAFERVGIQVEELVGLSPEEQFRRVAQALSEVEDPTVRTATAMELLGRAGKELIPLFASGAQGLDKFAGQLQATGSIMSQETVDAAAQFNDAMNLLRKQLSAVTIQLFSDVIPAFARFADFLTTEKGQEELSELMNRMTPIAKGLAFVIGTALVGALSRSILSMIVAQARVAQLTAQKLALAGASRTAAVAIAGFGTAVRIATGPIGIIITLLGSLALGYRAIKPLTDAASESTRSFRDRLEELTAQGADAARMPFQRALSEIGVEMIELSNRTAELTEKQRGLQEALSGGGMAHGLREDIASGLKQELNEVNQQIEENQNQLAELNEVAADYSDAADEAAKRTEQLTTNVEEQNKEIKDANKITEEYESLLDGLVSSFRPIRAAQQQFAQGMQIAHRALQSGKISLQQFLEVFQLLNEELQQGLSGQDIGTTFDDIKSALESEVEALEGGAEAWKEYAKAQEVAKRVAESSVPLTEQQVQEIVKLVDRLFEASGVTQDTAAQFQRLGSEMVGALRDAQSLFAQGSQEARAFEVAIAAVNIVLGVMAILKQLSEGDFFSAIPRAIAVAAIVASLGVGVNGIGGGGVSAAQRRQETQGTGGVLGDSSAKTDSIVNSSEITAKATSQLPGISRSMLQAIQSLQDGIEGAITLIARGGMGEFQSVDGTIFGGLISDSGIFGDIQDVIRGITNIGFGDLLTDALIGLFTGTPKIEDEGIQILGGTITELVDGVLIQAFQDVKIKSIFKTKNKELFADLDDSVSDQFTLIFQGIVDAVVSAADALGILPEEIQRRLDTFVVEAQKISLKDLNAEEQQAELLAVFGRIFDDLAAHVVPFIDQFQKVGEAMGETLVRVATSVQVFEEAVRRLGFSAERIDPEQFAQMSVGLIEAVGGIEEFISKMNSFVDNFASDSVKLQIAQDDLSRAFEMAGLVIPPTREAMFELMRSFDANTEAGREGIATLLRLADVADEYYSLLEDAIDTYAQTAAGLQESLALEPLSDFQREMVGIQRELLQTIKALNDSAKAAGLQAAREEDLARAHERAAIRAAQAIARLEQSGRGLATQLGLTRLGEINARIEALQQIESASQSAGGALQSFGQSLIAFADSLLIGSLSPLTSGNRLEEAMTQLLAASAAGDASAVQSLSQQVLQIGESRFGSGQPFTDLFNDVQRILRTTQVAEQQTQNVSIVSAPGMDALLKKQSELEAQQSERERVLLGGDLAQIVADVAQATGKSFEEVAKTLGFDLAQLGELLGLDEDELFELLEGLQVDTDAMAEFLEQLEDSIVNAITRGFEGADQARRLEGRDTGGRDRRSPDPGPDFERDRENDRRDREREREDRRNTDAAIEGTTTAVDTGTRDIVLSVDRGNTEVINLLRRIADSQETQPRNERATAERR